MPLRPGHIYDFGHEVIPELGKGNHEVTELLFWGSFTGMVVAALCPLFLDFPCRHLANLLRREFLSIIIVTILRIPTYLATVLPSTNYHCHPGAIEYDPPTTYVLGTRYTFVLATLFSSLYQLLRMAHVNSLQ